MRIVVDEDRCIASGQCVLISSDLFDQRDDDGVVILLDAHPVTELEAAARQAAALCPSRAITIKDDDG